MHRDLSRAKHQAVYSDSLRYEIEGLRCILREDSLGFHDSVGKKEAYDDELGDGRDPSRSAVLGMVGYGSFLYYGKTKFLSLVRYY